MAVLFLGVSSLIVPLVLWIAVAVQVALAGECLFDLRILQFVVV